MPDILIRHSDDRLPPGWVPFTQHVICSLCGYDIAVEVPPGYRSANRTLQRLFSEHIVRDHREDCRNAEARLSKRDQRVKMQQAAELRRKLG